MIEYFPITAAIAPDGKITLGGQNLDDLARSWGTPLYVYDAATLRRQVEILRRSLQAAYPGPSQVTYAGKAYFSLRMARHLAALGLGVDVVSLGELNIARQAGFAPQRVHLHGNNKSPQELENALKWGVQAIVVDSLDELALLEEIAKASGQTGRIWLRITPGLSVQTHPYRQTAHPASKFGLPIEDGQAAEAIHRAMGSRWLHLTGLHTHLGSQIFELEPYTRAVEMLCELARGEHFTPEDLSPGGGWGVRYVPEDSDEPVEGWVSAVSQTIQEQCRLAGWPLPKLILEPGRWLVAEAGVAVYTVGVVKTAMDGTCMVAVDGGMADNPRPALYQAGYTARLIPGPQRPPGGGDLATLHKVTVVGKFCETGDQLIPEVMLPSAQRGDLLVIPVSGAYHLSMASNYNLAPRPAVLWVDNGQVEVLQEREDPSAAGWWV
ncbi:MAG: diaminopimelate decarboxylase [Chloroflexi bacterium]|nr:diaminopimelate decarboxylase [Chloroflexota bacterium]